jgi:hypothetical protein
MLDTWRVVANLAVIHQTSLFIYLVVTPKIRNDIVDIVGQGKQDFLPLGV